MKSALKRLLQRTAPRLAITIESARARAHAHRLMRGWGCQELIDDLIARFGVSVQEGPFAGLTLTSMARADHLAPYLLGVYESELDAAWAVVLRGRYAQIVDVGAKFGYYALGLARRYPDSAVVAFDTDWWARRAMREMLEANALSNVTVRGFCTPGWLASHLTDGALVISDCEGYEDVLFPSRPSGALETATLIIETHDDVSPGLTSRLHQRFDATHAVHVVESGGRRRATTRDLTFLSEERRRLANQEIRFEQSWLVCLPRRGSNAALAAAW
jgi:hypothetical protein